MALSEKKADEAREDQKDMIKEAIKELVIEKK